MTYSYICTTVAGYFGVMIYQIIPAIIILIIKPVIRFILLSIGLSDHYASHPL